MWVVAKVNIQEVNTFKRKLIEKFGKEIEFYNPKIVYYKNFKNKIKKFEKFILENYIFCHHRKFANSNAIVLPIPREPPVTNTILPSNIFIIFLK